MDAFATRSDLASKFGEAELASLEDPDNTGVADVSFSSRALSDASEYLASYLATRYELPLPSVPTALSAATCDYARWLLYKDKATEEVKYRRDKAEAWALKVGDGKAQLLFDPVLTPAQNASTDMGMTAAASQIAGTFSDRMLDRMVTADKIGRSFW